MTDLSNPKEQATLLKACWQQLAAYAWDSYTKQGRGAVVLLEEVLKQKMVAPNVLKMTGLMRYTTKDTSPDGELPPGLEKYGNSYNPRQSVVVLFVTSNMDFDYHYIVTPPGEYPPPNAVLPLP